jgi:hypothetical protein
VREDDAGASVRGGVRNDLAHREVGAGLVAVVARQVEASRLIVDMSDPEALARWIGVGEAAGKEGLSGGEAVELERKFGTLIPHMGGLRGKGGSAQLNRVRNGTRTD